MMAQIGENTIYRENEIGINVTNLMQNFIKIGDIQNASSLRVISYKSKRSDKNWRLRSSLGFSINSNFSQRNFFHFAIGKEKLKPIGEKWKYFYGLEFLLNVGDDFFSSTNSSFNEGLGVSFSLGIMYMINPMISLSTESSFATLIGPQFSSDFIPPFSIQLNFYVKKFKKRKKSKVKSF